jgi:hypothetical protein
MRGAGEQKILGAELISASGEIENVLGGGAAIQLLTIEHAIRDEKAGWSSNGALSWFDPMGSRKLELSRQFDSLTHPDPLARCG